jgi:hypothetical protein
MPLSLVKAGNTPSGHSWNIIGMLMLDQNSTKNSDILTESSGLKMEEPAVFMAPAETPETISQDT